MCFASFAYYREVITTPYSFVATTHSLWWNGIKPVFVDIDSDTCNIDVDKIEVCYYTEDDDYARTCIWEAL